LIGSGCGDSGGSSDGEIEIEIEIEEWLSIEGGMETEIR